MWRGHQVQDFFCAESNAILENRRRSRRQLPKYLLLSKDTFEDAFGDVLLVLVRCIKFLIDASEISRKYFGEIYDSLYMERPYCLEYPCFGIFLTSNAIQESATIIAVAAVIHQNQRI